MDQEIEIVKLVVLKNGGLRVGYTFQEEVDGELVNNYHEAEKDAAPVQEGANALRLMLPHLLALTGFQGFKIDGKYLKSRAAIDDQALEPYRILKVELNGHDEDTTVQVWGRYHGKYGKIDFHTNAMKVYGAEAKYEFSGNLIEDTHNLFDEAEAYLGGKFIPQAQMALQL